MIRRALVLFALFTLTVMSAATAHEHGMRHTAGPVEVTTALPVALPAATAALDPATAWLTVSDTSLCADASDTCHNHGKFADCTCPAACAGLFGVAATSGPLRAVDAASMPAAPRRLLATSSAPPTPPPRA